ncbi:MAG: glycosyltransferase family 2 protein [Nitrososphaerota archaeon]
MRATPSGRESLISLVEDFVISKDFVKKGFKTWQSRTMVSIKSPNSLSDFWKQRARWFKGIFVELAKTHPLTLFFVILRLIRGISASLIFFPLWFMFPTKTFLSYFGFFGLAYYASAYLSGCVEAKARNWLSSLLISNAQQIIREAEGYSVPKHRFHIEPKPSSDATADPVIIDAIKKGLCEIEWKKA